MRLHEYLAEWRGRRFEPGRADCAQFVRGWVFVRTRKDFGDGIDYATISAGLAALRRRGFADHIDLAARTLQEVPVAMAQLGDIAVIKTENGQALAIIGGEHVYALGRDGLCVMPRYKATRTFACRR